ncbi:hypothetical protein [Pedobacter borealis]|uniref:hypothetical protein n=1 Tax=Pedobacter borealis TaxID=475254 RepID=UPI000492F8EA|nr:hypothetical protein [Pedobacter borealis]
MENPADFNYPEFDVSFYKSLKGKEAVAERLKGRQPVIDIKGQPYTINLSFGLLEPAGNFTIDAIYIGNIEMDRATKKIPFYFNTETRQRVFLADNITEFPKDVVRVEIPNKYFLDPVAMARDNGRGAENYRDYGIPLIMYRKAVIIPLVKTELLSVVNRNRMRAGMEILPPEKPKHSVQKKRSIKR